MNKFTIPMVAALMGGSVVAISQTSVSVGSANVQRVVEISRQTAQSVQTGQSTQTRTTVQSTGAIKGSGRITTTTRAVRDFSDIVLDGAANIKIKIGSGYSVRITTDDNLQKLFAARVQNVTVITSGRRTTRNRLVLGQSESIRPTKEVSVVITLPNLSSFKLDGAGTIEMEGLKGGDLRIEVDGAGTISARGTVNTLDIAMDGAGTLNLFSLKANNVMAGMDGAGSIFVNALTTLKAQINGVGAIRYRGTPRVNGRVEGVGTIRRDG